MKDLVIWCDDFVYMRVADTMHVKKLPRDEAMELLVPIWDQYVHKGVSELAARMPPSPARAASDDGTGDSPAPHQETRAAQCSTARHK